MDLAFLIKWMLLGVAAFIGGAHLGKFRNPKYHDDALGQNGHSIVAVIFITGSFIGGVALILEFLQILKGL